MKGNLCCPTSESAYTSGGKNYHAFILMRIIIALVFALLKAPTLAVAGTMRTFQGLQSQLPGPGGTGNAAVTLAWGLALAFFVIAIRLLPQVKDEETPPTDKDRPGFKIKVGALLLATGAILSGTVGLEAWFILIMAVGIGFSASGAADWARKETNPSRRKRKRWAVATTLLIATLLLVILGRVLPN